MQDFIGDILYRFKNRINFSKNEKIFFQNLTIDYGEEYFGKFNNLLVKIFKDINLNIIFQPVNLNLSHLNNFNITENDFNLIKKSKKLIKLNIEDDQEVLDLAFEIQFSVLFIFNKQNNKIFYIFFNIEDFLFHEICLNFKPQEIEIEDLKSSIYKDNSSEFYIIRKRISSSDLLFALFDKKELIFMVKKFGNASDIFGTLKTQNDEMDFLNTVFICSNLLFEFNLKKHSIFLKENILMKNHIMLDKISNLFSTFEESNIKNDLFFKDFSTLKIDNRKPKRDVLDSKFIEFSIRVKYCSSVSEFVKKLKQIISESQNLYLDRIFYKSLEVYPHVIFWENYYDEYLVVIKKIDPDHGDIKLKEFQELINKLDLAFNIIEIYKYDKINRDRQS